ncbi:MAG: choice-of-anchor Q domain-containing protein [Acidobacteriota bacterium]
MIRFAAASCIAFVLLLSAISAEAATFTVTKTGDSNDGTCDADCSLREAVTAANNAAGDDIIAFDGTVFGTAQTVNVTLGEIIIGASGTLTINGTGANMLTIDGNMNSRIFRTGAGVVATINDMILTRGNGVGALASGSAGAIYNDLGTLTLNNLIITGNSVTNNAGGIRNSGTGSVLTINNCIVSNNTAGTSSGGGIQNFSTSTVFINNSTFMGNTSGGTTGGGGGQFNGTARITNSTFANNMAPSGTGGGMQSNGSSMVITNSTFVGNSSTNSGGGINRGSTNVNFFIRNTIVAGNNGTASSTDITNSAGGISSQGNNIIGMVGTSTGWVASDLLNTNPMLNPLAGNGGFGMTFLPMTGSPAIDAGQNCVVDLSCAANNPPDAVTTDQRGVTRPQGMTVDIGAVEVAQMATNAMVSGRVLSPEGNAVNRVLVTISNGGGIIQWTYSNAFGNFVFSGIPTAQMYSINVFSKQYNFTPVDVTVNGDVSGITVTAGSENFGNWKSGK